MRDLAQEELLVVNGGELSDVNWIGFAAGATTLMISISSANVAGTAVGMGMIIDACNI
ncbi:hypothetical protein Halha_1947 [Halobacteroides halobius DSM 5150]|uniref:Uncharacterized protein n=1 Tax=Halobacteroides halobius (strain ATCC 35273 / DSM 5150 / MD-1) TaxID=748449 RepID=L0KBE5_HALHC|nr:hypothetical protein [Halobacteroides halobius]AGB41855.1 hypothetical protein Halha_1947 [Halobacteroides halobius DSM 5150]